MLICGVICEYDPFHKGHKYLFDSLRARLGGECLIFCAMNGHFTQRGQAALVSKWTRAEMALRCGADAVFELPTLFAVRDAERFALGGVSLLNSLGVVTHLGFGSETGDLGALVRRAAADEDTAIVREGLSRGETLARARGAAVGSAADTPNDTLALEYLRAIKRLQSGMEPIAIRREGSGHHDGALASMASATAVRAAIARRDDVSAAMPEEAHALLAACLQEGAYQQPDGLDTALLALLRRMSPETLANVADVSEGLENRLLRAAQTATGRSALLDAVKCKRYTRARLSRILTQAMLGITKDLAERSPLPAYARLLGFRETARPALAAIRKRGGVPVVLRAAKYEGYTDPAFQLDLRATDLWALGVLNEAHRAGRMDLIHKPVQIA